MTETDAKDRQIGFDQLAHRFGGVGQPRRVTGAIGKHHPIWLHGEYFVSRSIRRNDGDVCAALKSAFLPYRNGRFPVYVDYANNRARARLELGEEWNVHACEELIAALSDLDAVSDARLVY